MHGVLNMLDGKRAVSGERMLSQKGVSRLELQRWLVALAGINKIPH